MKLCIMSPSGSSRRIDSHHRRHQYFMEMTQTHWDCLENIAHLDGDHRLVNTKIDETGKIERTVVSTLTAKLREGVIISIHGTRLYGPTGTTGRAQNVKSLNLMCKKDVLGD